MHNFRLAISDIYKNAYTKQSKSVLIEVNLLELDVQIAGLEVFPDDFYPEQTLVARRFNKPHASLAAAIKQDFTCDQCFFPPLEEKDDEGTWYDNFTGPRIGKRNLDDTFQFKITDNLTKSTLTIKAFFIRGKDPDTTNNFLRTQLF